MRDLVSVVVIVAFFAIAAAYIGACARIVGRETAVEVTADDELESAT